MLPQTLPKSKFQEFVALLLRDNRVMAPMDRGSGQFAFASVHSPQDIARIRMDYDITILPPKKYLLPTYETLLEFDSADPRSAKAELKVRSTVLLGVHPYDLHGIATCDAFFGKDPADAHYLSKRSATRLIGLNLQTPANELQFQADMNTLEPPQGGFDLFLTDLGDRYFVEVGSDAGAAMLQAEGLFSPAGPEDHKAKQAYDKLKAANFPRKLPYDTRYLPELLEASYDSLLWEAISRRCFSCGTCTNVCPTCFCFDVQDKLRLDASGGIRQRRWDSCQLKVFAEVAGGENFRGHIANRIRHRMFRKGTYILERTGRIGCVGCGRCIRHCVANISILEAFQQIAGEAAEVLADQGKK
jgi:formate hydrogenlyase subunit 6/NADH:ubiquinone oxidoreductase subunit I